MGPARSPNKGQRQVLGRGLGALIPGSQDRRDLFNCPIDQIVPASDQPRAAINPNNLQELADSIHESGVLQPVLVRREGDHYKLICGERRWRAAQMAGLDKIPALVRDVGDDESFALALIENVQREDLTPIEEAVAFQRLIGEFGYTQTELAQKIGKGRSTIANTMRLLDLPASVRHHVATGRLSAGHARAVLSVPKEKQEKFAEDLVVGKVTVRKAETLAQPHKRAPKDRSTNTVAPRLNERIANLRLLERNLRENLRTRVDIVDKAGSGTIEIHYGDDDTLQDIIDRLLR